MTCPDCGEECDDDPDFAESATDRLWRTVCAPMVQAWAAQLRSVDASPDDERLVVHWRGTLPDELRERWESHGPELVEWRIEPADMSEVAARLVEDRVEDAGIAIDPGRHRGEGRPAVTVLRESAGRLDEARRIAAEVRRTHGVAVLVHLDR